MPMTLEQLRAKNRSRSTIPLSLAENNAWADARRSGKRVDISNPLGAAGPGGDGASFQLAHNGQITDANTYRFSSAQRMRRGWVEDEIAQSPFGGNALFAEGMRQDLLDQQYRQRMDAGARKLAEQQAASNQRTLDANRKSRLDSMEANRLAAPRPNYDAHRRSKRGLWKLSDLR